MRPYLRNLLLRMADQNYRCGETQEEGQWEAGKDLASDPSSEARQLDDVNLLPDLYNLAMSNKSEIDKIHVYFVLGFIAKNANNEEAVKFMLDRLKIERATLVILTILHRLAEIYKPQSFDLSIIYELIEKKGANIRRAAYNALTNSAHNVEDYLLDLLSKTTKAEDVAGIIIALGYIGTEKSISPLKELLKSRKAEIKFWTQNTLPTIMIRLGFPTTEICRVTKVSTNYLIKRKAILENLSRPG